MKQAGVVDAPGELGIRSMPAWLARVTRLTRPEAARRVRLAPRSTPTPQTREAVARGEVHPEQAVVITRAVEELPASTPPSATSRRST